jgi:hypothetical protein
VIVMPEKESFSHLAGVPLQLTPSSAFAAFHAPIPVDQRTHEGRYIWDPSSGRVVHPAPTFHHHHGSVPYLHGFKPVVDFSHSQLDLITLFLLYRIEIIVFGLLEGSDPLTQSNPCFMSAC